MLPNEAEDELFAGVDADGEALEGNRFVRCSFRGAVLDGIHTTRWGTDLREAILEGAKNVDY